MASGSSFITRIGSFTAVAWCTLGSALLGFFLLVTGAILTGIAYTEITPPNYDENYWRYQGANVMRIVGPLFMAVGGILIFGACGLFAFAFYSASKEEMRDYSVVGSKPHSDIHVVHHEYNVASYADEEDLEKK